MFPAAQDTVESYTFMSYFTSFSERLGRLQGLPFLHYKNYVPMKPLETPEVSLRMRESQGSVGCALAPWQSCPPQHLWLCVSEQLVHFSNPPACTLKLRRPKASNVGYYNSLSGKELPGQIAFRKVAEASGLLWIWGLVSLI